MTNNKKVLNWLDEMIALCKPEKVVWIDGSREQLEALREEAVSTGEMINGKKFEMLAVDLIKPMGSVLPFEVVREKEFAPIKNKTGVDSVESARALLRLNGVEL